MPRRSRTRERNLARKRRKRQGRPSGRPVKRSGRDAIEEARNA